MPSPSPKTKAMEFEPLIFRIAVFLQIVKSLFFLLTLMCIIPFMIGANHKTTNSILDNEQIIVLGVALLLLTLLVIVKNVGVGIAAWKGTFLSIQEGLQNHITLHNQRVKRFALVGCGSAIAHMIIGLVLSYLGSVFMVMLVDNLDEKDFNWGVEHLEFDNPLPFIVVVADLIFNIVGFGVAVWNAILVNREISHYQQQVKISGGGEKSSSDNTIRL